MLLKKMFLLGLCFSLFAGEKFHVCTVASNQHPRLDQLVESCQKHNIQLDILGMGLPYYKNGVKLFYISEYIRDMEDDEIVLFVDGYDTLIVADKEEILNKFIRSGKSMIMGAEKNCAPVSDLAPHFDKGPTHFRYINTGTYIGYVKNIKAWIQSLEPISAHMCDQYQTILHYIRNPKNRHYFSLDVYCEFFLPLFQVYIWEVAIDRELKKITCTTTGSTPCVLHANGQAFMIYDMAYRQLIADRSTKGQ